jgi:hypothetical protein
MIRVNSIPSIWGDVSSSAEFHSFGVTRAGKNYNGGGALEVVGEDFFGYPSDKSGFNSVSLNDRSSPWAPTALQ